MHELGREFVADNPGLYTVGSDYLRGDATTHFEYAKVTAVSLGEGRVSYVSPSANDGYKPTDLERFKTEADEVVLHQLAAFIDTYMADGAPLGSYNCHTFASHMVGGPETTNPLASRDNVVYVDRPLRPMELGIIYARGGDHSTVGLDTSHTIQVVTNHGNIGIFDHKQLVKQYGAEPKIVEPYLAKRLGIQLP
jgi:hypothetical protein